MTSAAVCAACQRSIDASAKLCPYCGANPATGERIDTQAILQEIFRPQKMTTSESVIEYARQRQGVVVGVSVAVVFVLLAIVHQFVTARNANAVTDAPPVPLTEIADLANQPRETNRAVMPLLDFQYEGRPQTMRTFILERGAVVPQEIAAGQPPAGAAQPRPGVPPATGTAAPQPQQPAPAPVRSPQSR